MFINPKNIIDELDISENEIVIDLGTGSGEYSLLLAKKLQKNGGVVYAVDIQQNILTRLAHTAKEEGLKNLHYIHADIEKYNGVPLQSNSASLVILSNVLFTSSLHREILNEAARLTLTGGFLLIIDWKESKMQFGPDKSNILGEKECLKLAMESGFSLEKVLAGGKHHFAILLRRNINN